MTKKPKILITNDDGIHAPGIYHLWNAIKDVADVTIVAPATEQSAVSLGLTVRSPLRISKVDWEANTKAFSVTGTPADCVKMALRVVLDEKPDMILSGINRGSNAGRTVIYSGTVAGVIEGTIQGIPGIAFSCSDYINTNYKKAEKYIPLFMNYLLCNPLPSGTLLNVNFPEHNEIQGIKMTKQGKEFWGEDPTEREHPSEGHSYYWLGAQLIQFEEDEDSDISWLNKGYVAAVPVHIGELTDLRYLDRSREHFEKIFST